MKLAWTILLKDLRLEGRRKDIFSLTVFFAALIVLIMGFAFGPDAERQRQAAPGILWCALALASLLAAGRAWSSEQEQGALESLLCAPIAHEWLFLGKLVANLLLSLLLAGFTTLLTSLLLNQIYEHLLLLALTIALGTLGLCIVMTFYAALTVNLRAREALLPVLALPIIIPVIIGAVKATVLLSSGPALNLDDYWAWTRLLIGFDLLSLLVATFAFPYALEA